MRQRAAASLLYQSKYAEAAFRNLLKLIFLKIVGRILAFYTGILTDDPDLLESALHQFYDVFVGEHCKQCKRKAYCSDPVID